ncbi:MAG TPA: hypothetical protein VFE69_09265, partial [Ilumatobacteraceae bacterium]|nr:hypothetical protein [Ilumatobacteraceae bacterium]
MHTFTKQHDGFVRAIPVTPPSPQVQPLPSTAMDAALAAAATLVSVAFALSTLDRYLRRRRPHDLAWSVSLGLFAAGAGALWWAETRGWSL